MNKILFNRRFRDIFLILTEFCPNRCVYCYIKDRHKHESMPMKYVDNLIASFEFEKPRIIFFGGEPLVELELMEQILDKYWDKCRFQIVTSATTNYERFIEEIYPKYPIPEIQLSWDGPGNINRPHLSGRHLQDEVLKKIIWTLNRKVKIDIKCVLNDTNIGNLYETYLYFKYLRTEYPRLVHGDFVVAHQKGFNEYYPYKLRLGLQSALSNIRTDLAAGITPYIPRDWLNKIIAVITKDNNISSCDAGNYIVMRPNGDLYPCTIFSQLDYERYKVGNINSKKINNEVFDIIKRKCSHDNCKDCRADSLCDGGCRYERYINVGEALDDYYCPHQCNTIQVFYDEFSKWLSSLTIKEKSYLTDYLQLYQRWALNYSLPRGE